MSSRLFQDPPTLQETGENPHENDSSQQPSSPSSSTLGFRPPPPSSPEPSSPSESSNFADPPPPTQAFPHQQRGPAHSDDSADKQIPAHTTSIEGEYEYLSEDECFLGVTGPQCMFCGNDLDTMPPCCCPDCKLPN